MLHNVAGQLLAVIRRRLGVGPPTFLPKPHLREVPTHDVCRALSEVPASRSSEASAPPPLDSGHALGAILPWSRC